MNRAIVSTGIAVIAPGYVLTAAGLVLALIQIRKVKAAATAAKSRVKTFSIGDAKDLLIILDTLYKNGGHQEYSSYW